MKLDNLVHGIGRYWFLILIGVGIIWAVIDDASSTLPPPATVPEQAVVQPSYGPAVSLPTGTVIKKVPGYLSGYGELQISNGTSHDAVAKLITTGASGTSIFTVYIKANSVYTIDGISDGTYRLAFAQGTDWDSTSATFKRDRSFSSFDDAFDFETYGGQYTTYEITLNAVEGGTAETSSVNGDQFNAY